MKFNIILWTLLSIGIVQSSAQIRYLKKYGRESYEYDFNSGYLLKLTKGLTSSDTIEYSYKYSLNYLIRKCSNGYNDSVIFDSLLLIKAIYSKSSLVFEIDYDSVKFGIIKKKGGNDITTYYYCDNGALYKEKHDFINVNTQKHNYSQRLFKNGVLKNPFLHNNLSFPYNIFSIHGIYLYNSSIANVSIYSCSEELSISDGEVWYYSYRYKSKNTYPIKCKKKIKMYRINDVKNIESFKDIKGKRIDRETSVLYDFEYHR